MKSHIVDQDTKITAETSAGADNDELQFYTGNTERMKILSNGDIKLTGALKKDTLLELDLKTWDILYKKKKIRKLTNTTRNIMQQSAKII